MDLRADMSETGGMMWVLRTASLAAGLILLAAPSHAGEGIAVPRVAAGREGSGPPSSRPQALRRYRLSDHAAAGRGAGPPADALRAPDLEGEPLQPSSGEPQGSARDRPVHAGHGGEAGAR